MTSGISQNEVVYRAIKKDLLEGRYMPGQRLESRVLSERHASSNTPVRMALSRLVADRIVEMHPNDGFHVPMVTEKSVSDLYIASKRAVASCLELLLETTGRSGSTTSPALPAPPERAIAALFAAIARFADNLELSQDVDSHNDRLMLLRRLDAKFDATMASDVAAMTEIWENGNLAAFKARLDGFYDKRFANISEVVKLAYLPRT